MLVTDPAFKGLLDKRYFQFFRQKIITSTNSILRSPFWDRVILQVSHSEPAVKHAVLALSSLQQGQSHELQIDEHAKRRHAAYTNNHYQKALSEARTLIECSTPEDVDRILIACIIFVAFEGIRGDFLASQTHLHSGRAIIMNHRKHIRTTSRRNDLRAIEETLFRLDPPAITFQHETSPLRLTFDQLLQTEPCLEVPQFETIMEAQASLIDLVRWLLVVGHLIGVAAKEGDRIALDRYSEQAEKCSRQLRVWHERFKQIASQLTPDSRILAGMLHIWHASAYAIARAGWYGPETRWDKQQQKFERIVNLAEDIVPDINKEGSFSIEIGYISPVFLAASRCRDPRTRRRAIALLKSYPRQEGLWRTTSAAALLQAWIDFEEEGLGVVECAADIPEHRRVQTYETKIATSFPAANVCFKRREHPDDDNFVEDSRPLNLQPSESTGQNFGRERAGREDPLSTSQLNSSILYPAGRAPCF